MITEDKARRAIEMAWSVGLYGARWFAMLGAEKVSVACNGCGPEWMGARLRDMLTAALDVFFPAFCIHDCRFSFDNDGGRALFDAANNELEQNCRILADDRFSWWNPRRYIWRHRARLVATVCRDFGWSAWRDANG